MSGRERARPYQTLDVSDRPVQYWAPPPASSPFHLRRLRAMPVAYRIDGRIIVVRPEGQYSLAELEDAVLLAVTDPSRPRDAVMLIDVRDALALLRRPAEDIRATARLFALKRVRFGHRLGLVAESDLAFGLMRIAQATAEAGGLTVGVFRGPEAARAWLLGEKTPPAAHGDERSAAGRRLPATV